MLFRSVDYDFTNPSFAQIIDSSSKTGYVFFNSQTGSGYQYSGSKIYDTGCPALSYTDAGTISPSIVSGQFNSLNKFKILGNTLSQDWTAFIVFKHSETGLYNVQGKLNYYNAQTKTTTEIRSYDDLLRYAGNLINLDPQMQQSLSKQSELDAYQIARNPEIQKNYEIGRAHV